MVSYLKLFEILELFRKSDEIVGFPSQKVLQPSGTNKHNFVCTTPLQTSDSFSRGALLDERVWCHCYSHK